VLHYPEEKKLQTPIENKKYSKKIIEHLPSHELNKAYPTIPLSGHSNVMT